MADDSPGALFRKGTGEFLADELQRLNDLADGGNARAEKVMSWVLEAADGREVLLTFPTTASELVELLGELARTTEAFVLARAAAFMLEHDTTPTHLRYQIVCDFEHLD